MGQHGGKEDQGRAPRGRVPIQRTLLLREVVMEALGAQLSQSLVQHEALPSEIYPVWKGNHRGG